MNILIIIIIILLVIVSAVLLFAYYGYCRCFYSPMKNRSKKYKLPHGDQYKKEWQTMEQLMTELEAIDFEQVYTNSFDGLKLAARYYQVSDDTPLHIQFHGYHGSAIRDFCGGNKIARENGCSTIVPDARGHGKSDGTTISFGINERKDVLSWINYARQRFGANRPIIIEGVSMGAATVLMAADLDLPDNVIGIVADCPYSSVKGIICKVARDMKLSPALMWPFVYLGARIFGGFNPNEISATEAIKKSRIPVLLIHGENDLFVPCDMSRELADACDSEVILRTFPDAGHGLSYIVSTDLYTQLVTEANELMLRKYLETV
ncbi:MAG: alpha/beta hydrolase [Firmicutes bacterium]|nr:alpha/beta hydrolase [Bacillota bacterium]